MALPFAPSAGPWTVTAPRAGAPSDPDQTPRLTRRPSFLASAAPAVLTLALAGALATPTQTHAQTTVEVGDDLTTGLDTATADNGAPADLLLNDDGSIEFDAEVGDNDPRNTAFDGLAAVTLNSSNGFTNEGVISIVDTLPNSAGDPSVGILARTDQIAGPSFIVQDGSVTVLESNDREDDGVSGVDINGDGQVDEFDIDPDDVDDGDSDGAFAEGFGRFGVLIEGDVAFEGDVTFTNSSVTRVEGDRSAAFRATTQVQGDVRIDGTLTATGDDTYAIDLQQGVAGDVSIQRTSGFGGAISATGEGATAIRVGGDVTGVFNQGATVTATGFESSNATNYFDPDQLDDDDEAPSLDADALLTGGPAVAVQASLQGGFLNNGAVGRSGVDNPDEDAVDDPDTEIDETEDEKDLNGEFNVNRSTGSITSIGSAPALLVQPLNPGEALDPNVTGGPTAGSGDIIIGPVDVEIIRDTTDDDDDDDTDELLALVVSENASDSEVLALAAENGVSAGSLTALGDAGVTVLRMAEEDIYGLVNRGNITGDGQNIGFTATAMEIRGSEDGSRRVLISDGVLNSGTISADAFEANATAVRIGAGAEVGRLDNTGVISSTVFAEPDRTPDALATGVLIEAGAIVPAFTNEGVIAVTMRGDHGSTVALRDASGTLTTIVNRSNITAGYAQDFDDDDGDGEEDDTNTDPDPITGLAERTGETIAIDVSANTSGVSLTQELQQVFQRDGSGQLILDSNGQPIPLVDPIDGFSAVQDTNGDDVIDADDVPNPRIVGDIRFGAGADTFNLLAGTVSGDVSFGAGADTFVIDGAANADIDDAPVFVGDINDSDNDLTLIIGEATVEVTNATAVNLSSLELREQAELRFVVDVADGQNSVEFVVSGDAVIRDGAQLTPEFVGIASEGSGTAIVADTLTAENLSTLLGDDTPFLYNVELTEVMVAGDEALGFTFRVKTPEELGLDRNQSAAFDSVIAAASTDTEAGTALGNISGGTAAEASDAFLSAYNQLLPDFSRGSVEMALAASDGAIGAVGNRLNAIREGREASGSVWAQEYFVYVDIAAEDATPGVRSDGFGIAAGLDRPLGPFYAAGLNFAFGAGEYTPHTTIDDPTSMTSVRLGSYLATALGPVAVDASAGVGLNAFESRRILRFGDVDTDVVNRDAVQAEWMSYQTDATLRIAAPMQWRALAVTPQVSATYLLIEEEGYKETGGEALNLAVESRSFESFSSTALLSIGARLNTRSQSWWSPQFRVGFRVESDNGPLETEARFVDDAGLTTSDPFVLTGADLPDAGLVTGFTFAAGSRYSAFAFDVDSDFRDGYSRVIGRVTFRFLF